MLYGDDEPPAATAAPVASAGPVAVETAVVALVCCKDGFLYFLKVVFHLYFNCGTCFIRRDSYRVRAD